MVCFCKNTMAQLQVALPQLNVAASATIGADIQLVASWLAQFGLPAAPWQPDPDWLDLELPAISLSVSAMATLSAFAQLRAGALALGVDLLVPGQAPAFTRLAATVNARLGAMLSASASASAPASASLLVNASAWAQLSATLTATAQVQAALALGIFPSPPPGPPLAVWRPFLTQLRALLPMVAISAQLGLSLSANLAVDLSVTLRAMLQIPMPAMPSATLALMASMTAALAAVAQIQSSLGVDPLAAGLPAIQVMVAEQVAVTTATIQQTLGLTVPDLLAALPQISYCPTLMAPPAVVSAAMALNLSAINWQVPAVADLPVLNVGLPVLAFTSQLTLAFGISPALSPCGPVCDAGALLGALL